MKNGFWWLLLAAGAAQGQVVNVSGTLTGIDSWAPPTVYRITSDYTVAVSGTLNVAAGTIIKFDDGSDLFVDGEINAIGTGASKIIITSAKDDSVGGDTNGDGNATSPAKADWGNINVRAGGDLSLDHAEVRFGGDQVFGWRAAIAFNSGSTGSVSSTLIRESDRAGIYIGGAAPTISNVDFQANDNGGIEMTPESNPAITNPSFSGNGFNGVEVSGGTLAADATWDDPGAVYHLTGNLTVPVGRMLTIEAGQIVKSASSRDLFIEGTLNINGTAGNAVAWTSLFNDAVGGDSNNDMSATSPAPGDWRRMQISASGTATIDHLESSFGGDLNFGEALLTIFSSAVTVDDSTFSNSIEAGIFIGDADPVIRNSIFDSNAAGAFLMTAISNPRLTGNAITNNGFNGAEVRGGTLATDAVWDNSEVPYHLVSDLTVPNGLSLTIGAGQIVKAASARDVFVSGVLDVDGTSSNPAVWTSLFDDSRGGDSNNDGNGTSPAPGDWRRFVISVDGQATIDNFVMAYGGDVNFGQGLLTIESSNVAVSNSDFRFSEAAGINVVNANPTVSDSFFGDNAFGALRMTAISNPSLAGLVFSNNSFNGMEVVGTTSPSADMTWDDAGVPYHLLGNLTVPAGRTLTIGSGQIVKTSASRDLLVSGSLLVNASAGNPAFYTSLFDDAVGGDSNNDGSATMPSPGDWRRIEILSGATASISGWQLAYGGQSPFGNALLTISTPGVTISDASFSNSGVFGLNIINADPVVSNSVFRDNAEAGVNMTQNSDARFDGNQFNNNAVNGVRIAGGSVGNDITWNSADTPYVVSADITLPAGRTLTVANGQIVKFANNAGLVVQGTLDAVGATGQPLIFTSLLDDTLGGDTNNDGNATMPVKGLWDFLRIDAGGNGQLENVEVHFAGIASGDNAAVDVAGTAQIDNALITRSVAGAIHARDGSTVLASNVVGASSAKGLVISGATGTRDFVNVTLEGNDRGIFVNGATATVTNALIAHSAVAGIEGLNTPNLMLSSSALFNPEASTGEFTGIADPIGQNGNLIGPIAFVDPGRNDFRPLTGTVGIDAGDAGAAPEFDLLGQPRYDNPLVPNTGTGIPMFVDMGALEAQDGIPGVLQLIANGGSGDRLGVSISVDGNRVAVGVPNAVGGGQVLIYETEGTGAAPVATIDVPPGFSAAEFGASLDLDGDEIAIGAPGTSSMVVPKGTTSLQAAVFERIGGSDWRLKTPVTATNGNADDRFGASVALDGGTMVVGAPGDAESATGAGAVYVFGLSGSTVSETVKLPPPNPVPGASFGTSVAMANGRLAAGAPGGALATALAGSVSLYEQIGTNLGSLSPVAELQGANADPGASFGQSIALNGDLMLVGAPLETVEAVAGAGSGYVFETTGDYSQVTRLVAPTPIAQGNLGMAVAFDGLGFALGGPGFNTGAGAVIRLDATSGLLERINAPTGSSGFGMAVGSASNLFAVGAPATDTNDGAAFARLRDVTLVFVSGFER